MHLIGRRTQTRSALTAAAAVGLVAAGIAAGASGSAQAADEPAPRAKIYRVQIRAMPSTGIGSVIVRVTSEPQGVSECLPIPGPTPDRERRVPYVNTGVSVTTGGRLVVNTYSDASCTDLGRSYGTYTPPDTDLDYWWLTIE